MAWLFEAKLILAKEEWMGLNDLRNDSVIIITKPDKGKSVVIENRHDNPADFRCNKI